MMDLIQLSLVRITWLEIPRVLAQQSMNWETAGRDGSVGQYGHIRATK